MRAAVADRARGCSQAIKANGQVFVSGMIGFNLEVRAALAARAQRRTLPTPTCSGARCSRAWQTMKLVSEDPVEQARQALQHLQNVLEAAGSSLDKVPARRCGRIVCCAASAEHRPFARAGDVPRWCTARC